MRKTRYEAREAFLRGVRYAAETRNPLREKVKLSERILYV